MCIKYFIEFIKSSESLLFWKAMDHFILKVYVKRLEKYRNSKVKIGGMSKDLKCFKSSKCSECSKLKLKAGSKRLREK